MWGIVLATREFMKAIEIIPLARKKLSRRGVPEEWVHETLRAPEHTVPGHGGRLVAQRRWRARDKTYLLRVVHEETQSQLVVITAYLTSGIDRYWRKEQ